MPLLCDVDVRLQLLREQPDAHAVAVFCEVREHAQLDMAVVHGQQQPAAGRPEDAAAVELKRGARGAVDARGAVHGLGLGRALKNMRLQLGMELQLER
jgi:hypothetical protein